MIDDFKDVSGRWVKSLRVDGKVVKTYSYSRWGDMARRCTEGSNTQKKNQTYIGCTMSPLFSDFQLFTDWHVQQVGYRVEGYNLDKDILFEGNKLYSENTCVLVPQQLNKFIVACDSARGDLPQGIDWHKPCQKYRAQLNIDCKKKYIGVFSTSEEASAHYKTAKESEARRWHSRLVAGEFVVDERVIECMSKWVLVT